MKDKCPYKIQELHNNTHTHTESYTFMGCVTFSMVKASKLGIKSKLLGCKVYQDARSRIPV